MFAASLSGCLTEMGVHGHRQSRGPTRFRTADGNPARQRPSNLNLCMLLTQQWHLQKSVCITLTQEYKDAHCGVIFYSK